MNTKTKKYITGLSAMTTMALSVQAATIVNWGAPGGDATIVTGNANGTYGASYGSTYVSPADMTNGYDVNAAGQTREYYGAMSQASGVFGVNNTSDHIQMVKNFGGLGGSVSNIIAWESPDFLTGDRELESFTLEFDTRGGSSTASYLLETSAGWYQSNETFSDNGYATITTAIGALTWSSYSAFGVTGGGATPADITDIQSVGLNFDSTLASGNWTGANLRHFEVTAVPEPSSAALLGLGGLALILRRRK